MNIINIEHISKLFGDKLIFDDASFGRQEGDKVGIVGINGTGKSTLLRMAAGEETPDSGQIIRQNNLKMAYLPQTPEFPKDATVLSYALSGDEEDWQVQSNLVQLGITEYDVKLDTLSGGQRRKVALAKVLASDFDVLILDEPTNHLDNAMLSWLEDYLKNYRGTVFMVTHDRYFLDKVSNRILEISHGKMYSYDSNYSRFLELKAEREEMELASERKRQSILRMELEWAKRGCRARSTKQRARLDRLEVLKNGTAPTADAVVEMDAVETRMGKKTIEFHNVSKAFGDKTLMKDFEYIFLRNQSVGIIGPNGCGKSTLGRGVCKLENLTSGHVYLDGEDITEYNDRRMRSVRKKVQMVFQDPYASLNPRMSVFDIIAEPLLVHHLYQDKADLEKKVLDLLHRVGLDDYHANRYPHEFSGGQRQRIGIARALAVEPSLIIADEPVSALDVSIQAQVLNLLNELKHDLDLTYIFVAHDLSVVEYISDRVGVMYLGNFVEVGEKEKIYSNPMHPYTQALLSAVPVPDPTAKRERILLEGSIPSAHKPPTGCKFHTRCPKCMECCKTQAPERYEVDDGHYVYCHLYDKERRKQQK